MEVNGDFVVVWSGGKPDAADTGICGLLCDQAFAPAVISSLFIFQTAPHRFEYTFDLAVEASLGVGDLLLGI